MRKMTPEEQQWWDDLIAVKPSFKKIYRSVRFVQSAYSDSQMVEYVPRSFSTVWKNFVTSTLWYKNAPNDK